MKKLIVKEKNIMHEYNADTKENLIEGLKDFGQILIDEGNDLMLDLFKEDDYEGVIALLYEHNSEAIHSKKESDEERFKRLIITRRNKDIKKQIFKLLKDITDMNQLEDIIDELPNLNNLFKKLKYDIEFNVE